MWLARASHYAVWKMLLDSRCGNERLWVRSSISCRQRAPTTRTQRRDMSFVSLPRNLARRREAVGDGRETHLSMSSIGEDVFTLGRL